MSFICKNCGEVQEAKTKPILLITKKRKKKYPERFNDEGKTIDKGGQGYETAEEKQLCPDCIKENEDGTDF